jgi:hypothetical protein
MGYLNSLAVRAQYYPFLNTHPLRSCARSHISRGKVIPFRIALHLIVITVGIVGAFCLPSPNTFFTSASTLEGFLDNPI